MLSTVPNADDDPQQEIVVAPELQARAGLTLSDLAFGDEGVQNVVMMESEVQRPRRRWDASNRVVSRTW